MRKIKRLKLIRCITEHDREKLYNEIFPSLPPAPSMTKEIIDGQPVIIVNEDEDMIKLAELTGELIHKSAKVEGLKEYIESNQLWRTSGFMGQFACALFFYGKYTVAFKYLTIGEPDNGDLELGNFRVNIITRATLYEDENYAIIDKRRFKRNPYPLYVACSRAKEDKIIVWGYARWDEVKDWDIKSFGEHPEAYYQKVNALHPIEELKELILVRLSMHAWEKE